MGQVPNLGGHAMIEEVLCFKPWGLSRLRLKKQQHTSLPTCGRTTKN